MKKLLLFALVMASIGLTRAQYNFGLNPDFKKKGLQTNNINQTIQNESLKSGFMNSERFKTPVRPNPSKVHQKPSVPESVLYSQDFENFTNGDMIFIDNDGLTPSPVVSDIFGTVSNWVVWELTPGNHVAASTSYLENGNFTADDWMITPAITIDPALQNPVYVIWDAMSHFSVLPDGYQVMISTTGTDLDDFTSIFDIVAENAENFTSRAINLTELGYSGQIYIAFHHNSTNMWNLYIDNIRVQEVGAEPDAGMNSLAATPYAAFGQEIHVDGSIMNFSSSNLTNMTVNWTLNGYGPYSENFAGYNLNFLETGSFLFSIPKQMGGNTIQVAGENQLMVWISNPNGLPDINNSNDTLSTTFTLTTDYVYYMDFNNYINGDMTMVDNDNVVPGGLPEWNYWVIWDDWENIYAASLSFQAGGQVDQWMITPPIEIGADNFLFWDVRTNVDDMDEVMEVLISTTGNELEDFEPLELFHETKQAWNARALDLTSYAGQTVYIAFRGLSNNQSYIGVDNIKIKQFYGLDLGVTSITVNPYIQVNNAVEVTGILRNNLAEAVTSFTLNYQINSGDVITEVFDNETITVFKEYEFAMSVPFTPTETGGIELVVWLSEVNGTNDDDASNDMLVSLITAVSFMPTRNMVIEEYTGTWCGWCPRGIVYLDEFSAAYPNDVIIISVHNSDPMVDVAYDAGMSGLLGMFPSALIDRKTIALVDPGNITTDYENNIDGFGYADLTIDIDYNSGNHLMTANISAEFAVDLEGDYRFACVLTQNDAHGTTSEYDQSNYYSGGGYGPMGGFENLPDPVPAAQMYFDFVAREILGGFNGEPGSLPGNIEANSVYDYTFTYTIPMIYNVSNMKAIVLLINYATGEIMNAKSTDIVVTQTNDLSSDEIRVFPNPANDILQISNVKGSKVQLVNMLGKVVYESSIDQVNTQINVSSFDPGLYLLKVFNGEQATAIKVIIE